MTHAGSLQTLKDLGPGDHLCCIYETEEEHRAVLTPFLRQGLERGEKVLYVVDDRTAETILDYLRDSGLDVGLYLDRGQLCILTRDEAYVRGGAFDPDAMIALLESETEQALAEGYTALRVTGEMSWALRGLPGSERLIEYEAKLNRFFPGRQCLAICQYDRRRFEPEVLLDVLRTHPVAVIGTEVYDNLYYIPPDELRGAEPKASELRHWIRNLAERKRTVNALRESGERYRSFFYTSMDAVFITSKAGRWIDMNAAAVELFGYESKEELQEVAVPDLYARPADRGKHIRTIEEQGFKKDYAVDLRRKDGSVINTLITSVPVRDDEGNVIGFQGTIRDITERRRAEEALQRRAAQLAILNDIGERIVAMLELNRVVGRAAHLVQEKFDYRHVGIFILDREQDEFVMQAKAGDFADLFPPGHRLELGQGMVGWVGRHGEVLLANDVEIEPRYVNLYPDVIPTRAELSVPIRGEGELVGVLDIQSTECGAFDENDVVAMETLAGQLGVAVKNAWLYEEVQAEVAERKRAEAALEEYSERLEEMVEERTQELREAQERLLRREKLAMLGQLAGSINHELRGPLGNISNAAYFLNMALEEPGEDVQETLGILQREVSRAETIVSSILDLMRTREPEREEVDVNRLVEDLLSRVEMPQDVEVALRADDSLPTILADSDQLDQILDNLIRNAVQAMLEGGRLAVRTEVESSEWLSVSIADTGVGISEEDQEKIFEPLFTTRAGGIGLGLALAQTMVEAHGGKIEVESEVGNGSTFTVWLPLAR